MSRVFVAHDRSLGRMVAIKVLSPEVAAELKTERFRLEIQLAAKLQHPHIVPLLFAGDAGGLLYFTMPFIDGESLRAKIARDGPLPLNDAVRTLRQLASALAYAHRQGVVHRDIKPDNVLLAGEFALVTDFGVAKALTESVTSGGQQLTSGGMAIGTPAYMAPEQALADPAIDHRADIYAFGIVAYELLTGAPPFRARTAQATLAAHITQSPEPVRQKREEIPPALASIIMRCLEKKPEDRPQSANELLQLFDSLATGNISGATAPTVAVPAPKRSPRQKGMVAGAATIVLISAAWYLLSARTPSVSASTANLSSVAVLPLENVGGSADDEYFSDGLTDELASALARLPGLRVASRTSAYSFKGRQVNLAEIGKKLNVQAVIEGSVRRSGNRLRVHAQLVNVSDGLTLWSSSYESDPKDVFYVQDSIARSIATAVRPRLGRQEMLTLSSDTRGTSSLDAWHYYQRGRHHLNARGAENLRLSVAYFDSAIVRDPAFARAYAGRASSYALLPEYTDTPPPNSSAAATASANRALELDPQLAEAYLAMGLAGVHDWKFGEAEAAYKKALELDPRHATAHQWFGELLYHTGRTDSSIAHIRRSGELDPLAPVHPAALGYSLYANGQYDAAIRELRKGIELAPTLGLHHAMLGNIYLVTGQYREALRSLEESTRLEPELAVRQGYLAYALARNGNEAEARAIVAKLTASHRARRAPSVALAIAYLGLDERESALAALEQAVAEHDISLVTAASLIPDPIFNSLRGTPRFTALLERMNLSSYARR